MGGVKAIEAVLALHLLLDDADTTINLLEDKIIHAGQDDSVNVMDVTIQLRRVCEKRSSIVASLHRKSSALGVNQWTNLNHTMDDDFVKLRMNAYLLKQRIHDQLQQWKFEIQHLERSYCNALNGDSYLHYIHKVLLTVNIEQKLNKHVGDSVKQQDPGIQRLVKSYNDICIQICHIAPRQAFLPCPLDMVGLYNLDVDDAIWHDRGLGEETEDNIAG